MEMLSTISSLSPANEERLLTFWRNEKASPRWLADSVGGRSISEEDFLAFCKNCWNIYDIGDALLYVEQRGEDVCEIHFSVMRGSNVSIRILENIKFELLQHFNKIFGWVITKNKGLQGICEKLGMKFNGVKMIDGSSHGRVLTWKCFMLDSQD